MTQSTLNIKLYVNLINLTLFNLDQLYSIDIVYTIYYYIPTV